MAIIQGSTNFKVYKGTRKPQAIKYGSKHVKGWGIDSTTTFPKTFTTTYNDTADILVSGNTVQQSEWVHKQGLSTQDGTPTPEAPIPIVSNLPAGTYKTQDYWGHWYEFTLTDDLQGINGVFDSIEFDRIGHGGWLRKNCIKKIYNGSENESWTPSVGGTNTQLFQIIEYSTTPVAQSVYLPVYCSHAQYKDNLYNLDVAGVAGFLNTTGDYYIRIRVPNEIATNVSSLKTWLANEYAKGTPLTVIYQLATPTRTPLTFTLNNSSTAPECPMEFLTSTPSFEYPAEVFDASGTVTARGKNLFDLGENNDYYVYAPAITQFNVNKSNHELSGIVQSGAMSYVFKNRLYKNNGIAFTLSGQFTGTVRWLIRLLDENQNNVSSGKTINGATYNSVYSAFYSATSPFAFTILHSEVKYIQIGFVFTGEVGTRQYLRKPQLEIGSAATPYEPYRPEVTAPIPPLRSVGDVKDEFNIKNGKLTRKIGVIESYNGETITGDYISTTGGLDVGAKVIYVLPEPFEEQYDPVTLPTYYPTTVVEKTDTTPAEMAVTATVRIEET